MAYINNDGDRNIYEPITKLSLDETSPSYGVKNYLCAYHITRLTSCSRPRFL
jgi:hypothetical protein